MEKNFYCSTSIPFCLRVGLRCTYYPKSGLPSDLFASRFSPYFNSVIIAAHRQPQPSDVPKVLSLCHRTVFTVHSLKYCRTSAFGTFVYVKIAAHRSFLLFTGGLNPKEYPELRLLIYPKVNIVLLILKENNELIIVLLVIFN